MRRSPRLHCKLLASEDGAEVVEFGLVLLPLLAFVLLLMDISWVLFAQSTLQHAAREGVRYAASLQAGTGNARASIRDVVTKNSFGFVKSGSNVVVNYYNPATLAAASSGAAGNVVEIVITGVKVYPLGPLWRSGAAVSLTARSSDTIDAAAGGR